MGNPINTYSGNYNYEVTDLALPTRGLPLRFERAYNSLTAGLTETVVYSQPLGYGWSHNFDISLTFPDDPYGEPDTVILKAPHGSRMRFKIKGDGTYDPYPGVWAELVRQEDTIPYTYVVTTANQTAYIFGAVTGTQSTDVALPAFTLTPVPPYGGSLAPGAVFSRSQTLSNTGQITTTFSLTVGETTGWMAVDPLSATVGTGEAITVTTTITVPASGQATNLWANVQVMAQANPSLITLPGYRLRYIRDPQGHQTELQYDSELRLAKIIGPSGERWLSLSYDAQDRLAAVSDNYHSAARQISYTYDEANNLAAVNDTRGFTWTYSYSGSHLLHAITDPTGKVVERSYFNQAGRAIRQEDGLGNALLEIAYLGHSRRITENGVVMIDTYNAQNLLASQEKISGATGLVTAYEYDEYFNREQVQQPGIVTPTQYVRNQNGLTTKIIDPLGYTTVFTYDARNNLIESLNARNLRTTYGYDAQNNLVTTTHHLADQTITSRNVYSGSLLVRRVDPRPAGYTTYYTYTARFGERTAVENAVGGRTDYQYDAMGRLLTTTIVISGGTRVTVNEYDGGDNLVRVTENYLAGQSQNYQAEYNLVTAYGYDGAGRRIYITDTLGQVTRHQYDLAGRLITTTRNYDPGQPANAEYNLATGYGYDQYGRQVRVTDQAGRVSATFFDPLGRMACSVTNWDGSGADCAAISAGIEANLKTGYGYDATGNLIQVVDPAGQVVRSEYDALGRVARTIVNYEDGQYNPAYPDRDLVTAYSYDAVGNQQSITDPGGRTTTYDYDQLNRVKRINAPLNATTVYTYDEAGNRTQVEDAAGRISRYVYDGLNRVITTTHNYVAGAPADAVTNVTGGVEYDIAGNRTHTIDPNGHVTSYTYDSLGRLIRLTDAENNQTTYSYNALGHRLAVTDAENHTTAYSYDPLYRLKRTQTVSGTTVITYDVAGNRVARQDANGHTTSYQYDDLNRLIMTTGPTGLTTTVSYDSLGNRRSLTNGAGEKSEFFYDAANRLVRISDPAGHETSYGYDAAGNRISMTDAEGVETRYQYDALDRLTGVIENYGDGSYQSASPDEDVTTTYGYDAVGNRLAVTNALSYTTVYTYDALNRRVAMADPLGHVTGYGYDAAGNRTVLTAATGQVTRFSYDGVNRLIGIDYPPGTADVSFTYDGLGNRRTMNDGSGQTGYDYDALSRLTAVSDGQNQTVGYRYDAAGNRTHLIYPDNRVVTYTYDAANRLDSVTDWRNGQFGYNYDQANRLSGLSLPNNVQSSYDYDQAGRLTLLSHANLTGTIATYAYGLDDVGNRTTLTESLAAILTVPAGAYLAGGRPVVIEAEQGRTISDSGHAWLTATARSGYTGTGYLQAEPDIDALYQPDELTVGAVYTLSVSAPATYTVWLRGYAPNAAGDSAYVSLAGQVVTVTGLAPARWDWANLGLPGGDPARLTIRKPGVYTLGLWLREDGLLVDRLLLTTDTAFLPAGFGPAATLRQQSGTVWPIHLDRTIVYTYDSLYRLTGADYSTGESFAYEYDPVGNRLAQIIDGDTTAYHYDAANRLAWVSAGGISQTYTFDANGNLLATGALTNSWDAANRLVEAARSEAAIQPLYNGLGHRVGQTTALTTTYFALDVVGLPEVIYTGEGDAYLHLPGVIVAESAGGEVRYLLSDGLGSIRQAVDEAGSVVAYNEYDPYGNPVQDGGDPYGFTGEWWQSEVGLLHLRARWYWPQAGLFLSRDAVESEPPYQYVRGNVVNRVDPSGNDPPFPLECLDTPDPIMCWGASMWQTGGTLSFEEYQNYTEIIEAIHYSKRMQEDDGIIFGLAIGAGATPLALIDIMSIWVDATNAFGWFSFNECSLPVTGYMGGLEIVYDFKHQERGIFHYHGPAFNGLIIVNTNVSKYIGKTRGFDNPNYQDGVLAYAGYFLGFNMSINAGALSGVYIEAAPLKDNEEMLLHTEGVFATYYALSAGIGVGGPVNLEITRTYYDTKLFSTVMIPDQIIRERYLFGNDANKKKDIVYRKRVAFLMTAEIITLANMDLFSKAISLPFVSQAIIELFDFVGKP